MESNTVMTPGTTGKNGGQNAWSRDTQPRPEILAKTQEVAGQLADQARQQVKSQFEHQKERATGSLESVAQALHAMGDQLRGQNQKVIAECAESMGETVERFMTSLRDKDINHIAHEVETFARRQPALFLTSAFALGFLASRFFKSSSPYNGSGYAAGRSGYDAASSGWQPAPPTTDAGTGMAYTSPSASGPVAADAGGVTGSNATDFPRDAESRR